MYNSSGEKSDNFCWQINGDTDESETYGSVKRRSTRLALALKRKRHHLRRCYRLLLLQLSGQHHSNNRVDVFGGKNRQSRPHPVLQEHNTFTDPGEPSRHLRRRRLARPDREQSERRKDQFGNRRVRKVVQIRHIFRFGETLCGRRRVRTGQSRSAGHRHHVLQQRDDRVAQSYLSQSLQLPATDRNLLVSYCKDFCKSTR
jgi:hypothetical protein